MAIDADVLAVRLLQKFVKSGILLHASDCADEVFPQGHFLHGLHHHNEKEVVGVGLLEVDELLSKKNDRLAEGLPLAIEGLEQSAERVFVVRRALGAVKQKKSLTKSEKENFLLRLADSKRDAIVLFLVLNIVALQGTYALALGH
eukprot:2715184-Rhodomonas_salina.2